MDSGINPSTNPPRCNRPHKRTPRRIVLASGPLAPEENARVRGVMLEAKKLGRKFAVTVKTTTINGCQVERQVDAWHTRRPPVPKAQRPLCGARTRAGTPCKARVVEKPGGQLSRRCRLHGGKSTGPRTLEGQARVAESNRRRAKSRAQVLEAALINNGATMSGPLINSEGTVGEP